MPKLVDLDLSDCDFSQLWTKKIAPKTFPSLKYLNVSNNVLKKLSPADFNVSILGSLLWKTNFPSNLRSIVSDLLFDAIATIHK